MKIKLVKSVVEKLPFTENGRQIYTDATLKGFGLRIGKEKKVFYAEKRVNGKAIRVTIGSHGQITAEKAREEAQNILGSMSGRNPINPNEQKKQSQVKGITLKETFDGYKAARGYLKPRTVKDYEYALNKYLSDWQRKSLSSITRDMVESRHKWIGDGHGGKAQANQTMRFLRSIYNYAIGRFGRGVVAENPVEGLSLTRSWFKVKRRQTVIKPHEFSSLFDALDKLAEENLSDNSETTRDFFIFLLFTGLRKQEGLGLKWKHVDFIGKTFTVVDTKNNDPLILPTSDFLFNLLTKRFQKRINDFVFPGKDPDSHLIEPKRHLIQLKALSGTQFSLHDIRRTFITVAESLDIPYYALKKLVNHRLSDVTAGYIVSDVERLRKPMQFITDKILMEAGRFQPAKIMALPGFV